MRSKILMGLLGVAITGIVTGTYLCNRSGAQDAPATGKLYETLKKDLAAKKDVELPALPALSKGSEPPIPPPMVVDPKASDSIPPLPPEPPSTIQPLSNTPPPAPTAVPRAEPKKDVPPTDVSPIQVSGVTPPPSVPTPVPPPPLPTKKAEADVPMAPVANVGSAPTPLPSPPVQPPQPQPSPRVLTPQASVPPLPKNSPWSFHVEVAENQTTVTATVNKKHAFKIVCKHVDLQTEQSTLRAKGNVQITGEMMEGSCTNLSIPLLDDRVVLEGAAEVRIHKNVVSSYTANPTLSQFELKGETLNLRLSELQSTKLWQTSLRQDAEPTPTPLMAPLSASPLPAVPGTIAKNWSPNGKLRRTDDRHGNQQVWCLEDSQGRTICRFVTREGGSLNQYVGQTISVHLERFDASMQRVTHIAIP